jgi:3-hydroxyacyl-CoA dehydrogenase
VILSPLAKLSEKGKIQEVPELIMKRIKIDTSVAKSVSEADFVIEPVFPEVIT